MKNLSFDTKIDDLFESFGKKKLLKQPKINTQKIRMYSTPKNFQLE